MSKIKLTYFDFNGGRGESIRLAMCIGKIPFEDQRLSFDEWRTLKSGMPFKAIPVLEVDGKTISQCNTINRFVGKLTSLYPEDTWQAALCDEVMDAVEDINHNIIATFHLDNEEKEKTRKELADGKICIYLQRLEENLLARGGEYFADNRLTIADLKVFVWIRNLRSGILDHIPADIVDKNAPSLVKHCERLNQQQNITAYYAKE